MKKIAIIFGLSLVILAVLLTKNTDRPKPILETKEGNEGSVAVKVIPKDLWNFEIVLDTHSEELNADLVANSQLVDNQGKSYKPTSWEGSPPGGHHRKGLLKFNPISPQPKSLELKIKDVGGIPERSFKWNL